MKENPGDRKRLPLLLFATLALSAVVIVVSLFKFTKSNSARVTEINREYLTDNAVRIATGIDKEISQGYANIRLLSALVSDNLSSPEFDVGSVSHLIRNSVFDFMEFADTEGMDHNITGGVSDAHDRKYYLDAKAGNSGMELILVSRATHETLMMFYAPVTFDGAFAGSLVGVYQASNRLTADLKTSYFGEPALSYLAEESGRIIASSEGFEPGKVLYIPDLVPDEATKAQLKSSMVSGAPCSFTLPGNDVGGCMVRLPENGYYLIQIFPAEANVRMTASANALGYVLAVVLLAVYMVLMIALIVFYRNKQRQLTEAKRAAEIADEAKTKFLFNMSHDIRTPMNAIIGFTNMLEKTRGDDDAFRHCVGNIRTAGDYLLHLINNVLDMARIESGKATLDDSSVWDANRFNDSLVTVFSQEMDKKHLTLTRTFDIEHPDVYVDTTKLEQIYINILSNAVKYTPAGGSITMDVKELPSDRPGYCLYRTVITDTGIGMSPEFLAHVFDEFAREKTTTDSGIQGTGLGMGIVKKLVDLMNGTIEIESEQGKGTRVTVCLPHRIADSEALRAAEAERATPVDLESFRGKRILLAEDNELNAEIAEVLLEELGFLVEHAEDGIICTDMLSRAAAGYYDLILMDIQMPNMDGYKATKSIRSMNDPEKAHIPVIAMTANAFEEDKRNAFEAGMDGHVSKPVHKDELARTLAGLFGNNDAA
ncbi:MAG: ATP-binding protein [Clostridia bacterium]|nr:ATP-binding protein [Clostridia bacterium]